MQAVQRTRRRGQGTEFQKRLEDLPSLKTNRYMHVDDDYDVDYYNGAAAPPLHAATTTTTPPAQSRGDDVASDVLTGVDRGRYMEKTWRFLEKATLMDVCLLGSHDSLTFDLSCNLSEHDVLPGEVAWMGNKVLTHKTLHHLQNLGRTHALDVEQQFAAGVRMFDFKAVTLDGKWYSLHSFTTEKTLDHYLRDLKGCLTENRGEVCVATLSKHGTQKRPRGTDLDKLGHSEGLWKIVVGELGDLLVHHSKQPVETTTLGEYVKGGRRLLLYVDGWEVVAPGDDRAGQTDQLQHTGILSADIHMVRKNTKDVISSFLRSCHPKYEKGAKYCYAGLNSANSTREIVKVALSMGNRVMRKVSSRIKSDLDPKLAGMGAHPYTLLSYAQMSLYYAQFPLMEVLGEVDEGNYARLPQAVQTDAVTDGGKVRVGWLSLGLEKDVENSLTLDMENLSSYFREDRLVLEPQKASPRVGVQLRTDVRKSCYDADCKMVGREDAARASFDVFRYCFALTLAKLKDSASSSESSYLHDVYMRLRRNVRPTYVDCKSAGLTLDVKKIAA